MTTATASRPKGPFNRPSTAWKSEWKSNEELVDKLRNIGTISSDRVAEAMLSVDRGNYCSRHPYRDRHQSIGYNAFIAAPHVHAYILEVLKDHLVEGAHALDVGSGSGYLTACMAHMVGDSGRVVGVEHIPELVDVSKSNLKTDHPDFLTTGRVKIIADDGRQGFPFDGPYDAIHVGAASPEVPDALIDQLRPGGRLLIPVGPEGRTQFLEQVDKLFDGSIKRDKLAAVTALPLTEKTSQWPTGENPGFYDSGLISSGTCDR